MRQFLLMCGLLFFATVNAQEQPEAEKGLWLASTSFGLATIAPDGITKFNGQYYGGSLGREFYISPSASLLASLESQSISGDFTDGGARQYYSHQLLKIPVAVRFYAGEKSSTAVFIDMGAYYAHIFKSEVEISGGGYEDATSTGNNFGLAFNLGISHRVTERLAARIALTTQSDFAGSGSDAPDTLFQNMYGLSVGIGFRL